MSGHVGDLSYDQQTALDELRDVASDIIKPDHDNYFLLRWLRARKFDVSKAEMMLRNHLRWRKRIGADEILTDYENPEVLKKYVPYGYLGLDKGGSPIRACYFGKMDMRGLSQSITTEQAVKCITKMIEEDDDRLKKQVKKFGNKIETHTFLFDMDGFCLKQLLFKPVYRLAGILLTCYESNYPEQLKCAYFINAPPYFTVFYAMLKAVFPEETMRKLKIFSPADNWKESLLEDIDANILPRLLGGTRIESDGDPCCPTVITPACPVPESYYLKNIYKNFPDEPGVKTVTVQNRGIHSVEVEVLEPNCVLKWEFMAGKHDIGFRIFLKNNDDKENMIENELIEVVSTSRIDTSIVPGIGCYTCKNSGTYIIQFDNSYSWLNKKDISYRIQVVPPKGVVGEKENFKILL